MRLTEIPALLIDEVLGKLRRFAIAGAIVAVCGVAATIEGVSAARQALEPIAGAVGARLILTASFVLIAAVAVGVLMLRERRAANAAAARREEARSGRAAILAEAISLGYALGQDFMKASPESETPAASPESETPDEDEADADDTARPVRGNGARRGSARAQAQRPH